MIRRHLRIRAPWFLLLALCAATAPALQAQKKNILDPRSLAPFVPTPQRVVEQMLQAAEVSKDDVVYDLGSGDGRVLFTAAERFGARAVGVELSQTLVEQTRRRIEELGLRDRVSVLHQHLLEADLKPATVVTVYLLTSSNTQLMPKLERELNEGARVVSHDFQFMGWQAKRMIEVDGESRRHRIYLYQIGEHRKP